MAKTEGAVPDNFLGFDLRIWEELGMGSACPQSDSAPAKWGIFNGQTWPEMGMDDLIFPETGPRLN